MSRIYKYYPFAFSALTLLLAAIVLISLANRNHDEFVHHQHEIMEGKVNGVANQVALLVEELRLELNLLSQGYTKKIAKIYDNPEDEKSFDEFKGLLTHFFPNHYTFTLVDEKGIMLIDDFGETIGDLCKNDIKTFTQSDQRQQVYIHPGPGTYHFDVMVPWTDNKDRRGVFFVSFKPDMIIRLLRDSETKDHKLLLLRTDTENLIEVSSEGDRSSMKREPRISAEEKSRIGFSSSVRGTKWKLVSVYRDGLIANDRTTKSNQVLVALSGFLIMGVILILLVRRAERKRELAEIELIQAKEEADNSNQAKSQFLSFISHELRTPLNAIMGFSELMIVDDEYPLPEHQMDEVKTIHQSSLHLLDLINGLLDLAKIESGRTILTLEKVNLVDVLDESLRLIKPLSDKRGIQMISNYKQHGSLYVHADRMRIKEIVMNIMSNAVKYNSENGSITVCAERDHDYIRIEITDTGNGLTEEQQKALFEPFNRLGAKENIQGTGIGLTITKHLVEMMNGEIGVISKEGIGSTFWIVLPIASKLY